MDNQSKDEIIKRLRRSSATGVEETSVFTKVRVMAPGSSTPNGMSNNEGEEEEEEEDMKDVPPAQRLIRPEDVLDLADEEATELEWNGTMGLKLTVITGLERLKKLEYVSFRSGFIRVPSGLAHLAPTLAHLALYENRLRTLKGVETLTKLRVLDVSYNRLGHLQPECLLPLVNLEEFYAAENRLTEIDPTALSRCTRLRILDLGGNELRRIQGLETLVALEDLWLGKNKITEVKNLERLTSLRRLSIQSNRLTKIQGLSTLTHLRELYLSDQGICAVEGLDEVAPRLEALDLTNNKLTSTAGMPPLPCLTDLWFAANQVTSYEEIERLVPLLPKIDTLVFERNPIAQDFEYRKRVKAMFPTTLTVIDATPCV